MGIARATCTLMLAALGGMAHAEPPRPASRPAAHPASRPATAPGKKDDLAEIERALASDRAVAKERRSQPPGPSSAPSSSAGGRGLLQSLNPELSMIADVALSGFSTRTPLLVGGHDPRESGFTLQALELVVAGSVDPYFRFDASLVFSKEGVELEEVYATSLSLPLSLQVRAGQLFTPFGRLSSIHLHSWSFLDQVLVLGKFFGGDANRGLGVELSVLMPLPWYVLLLLSVTDARGESTARSFYGATEASVDGVRDFQYTFAAKQFFPLGEDLSLMWGLSAAIGPNPSGRRTRTDIFGTDLYLRFRPIRRASSFLLSLETEWLLRRRQAAERVLQDHGLYATLLCRFARRWTAAGRYEYVTGLVDDPLDADWTGLRQRASAALTFFPTEFSRLRLQYEYDRPAWRKGYHGVMLGFEFAVGAHGAHKF